jgi:hypothetical protein
LEEKKVPLDALGHTPPSVSSGVLAFIELLAEKTMSFALLTQTDMSVTEATRRVLMGAMNLVSFSATVYLVHADPASLRP